jgi:hypothetical protein
MPAQTNWRRWAADARQVLPDDPYSLCMCALTGYHLAPSGYGNQVSHASMALSHAPCGTRCCERPKVPIHR